MQVELGKCRGKTNKRLCIAAAACEGDYGAPLIEVPLSLLHKHLMICKGVLYIS